MAKTFSNRSGFKPVVAVGRWIAVASAVSAVTCFVLWHFGKSNPIVGVLFAATTTGVAFALREPFIDGLNVWSIISGRVASVGERIVINEDTARSGVLVGFGLRSLQIETFRGDLLWVPGGKCDTVRNTSRSDTRVICDVEARADISPSWLRETMLQHLDWNADGLQFTVPPECLGVVSQSVGSYTMRFSAFVEPDATRFAEGLMREISVGVLQSHI
jgi:hypothetical protein